MSARQNSDDVITVALVKLALAWRSLPKRQQQTLLKLLAKAVQS